MNKQMNKKLLIIAPYQFGELSDCFYWAKYATLEGWNVTYIGFKYKYREVKERTYNGVMIKSVMHYNNRKILGLVFYLKCIFEILYHNHRNIIICRMPMCHILPKIFPQRNIILDVRTLSVSRNSQTREEQDNALKKLKKEFKKCSVISEGVGQKIEAPYEVLPLGAEPLSIKPKSFDKMRLFYIGTFNNRNLSIFIEGLALYQSQTGSDISFDIVGGGSKEEVSAIKYTIETHRAKNVKMHGYLTHDEAQTFFDKCNVGVCFVPVTEYYQYQPPTKLYEYLLSGMVCIATNTQSNKEVINEKNGVIIHDTAKSVCDGLNKLQENLCRYNSKEIVFQSKSYHWSQIVNNRLLKLFI